MHLGTAQTNPTDSIFKFNCLCIIFMVWIKYSIFGTYGCGWFFCLFCSVLSFVLRWLFTFVYLFFWNAFIYLGACSIVEWSFCLDVDELRYQMMLLCWPAEMFCLLLMCLNNSMRDGSCKWPDMKMKYSFIHSFIHINMMWGSVSFALKWLVEMSLRGKLLTFKLFVHFRTCTLLLLLE